MPVISVQQLIQEWQGKHCEAGGSANAKNQCVDLANQFLSESALPKVLGANAVDFPSKIGPDWEWEANTADNFPMSGNLVIWGSPYGKYTDSNGVVRYAGHIGVCVDGDKNGFRSFDQNWTVGQVCTIINHGYAGVKGWLKYKGGSMSADMYTMKSGHQVDLANRGSNVVLADKFDEVMYQGVYVKTSEKDAAVKEVQDKLNDEQKYADTLSMNALSVSRLLGLPDNATNDQVLAAINSLKTQAGTPSQPGDMPKEELLINGRKWALNGLNLSSDGKYLPNYKRAD